MAMMSPKQLTEVLLTAFAERSVWYDEVEVKQWPDGAKLVEEVPGYGGEVYVHAGSRQLRLDRTGLERGVLQRAQMVSKPLSDWLSEMDTFEADAALQLALFRVVRY